MFGQSDILKKGKRPDCRFYLDSLRQLPTAGFSFNFNSRFISQWGGACFGLILHDSSSRSGLNPYSHALATSDDFTAERTAANPLASLSWRPR